MYLIKQESQSLIGTLTKEVYTLRLRCKSVSNSIIKSKDENLIKRLQNELISLEVRRTEILEIAIFVRKKSLDELAIDFLIEIINRS